ncbi:MAG: bifunctional folylpolyglutamate synthase/dihydrofolate synthase [Bacteroidetes bacterium]|nr:bifunctional folylpolyglutamate synthase/dihydrofolate synthase [Bacteroidota bacterium]
MNYNEALEYLYAKLPMFTRIGAAAYKNDLHNTIALCRAVGNPQNEFKSIHIAGTNGKGSVSHLLASVLQEAGYKTGLYTSPHLVDFRERIRINGEMMPQQKVVDFVLQNTTLMEEIEPSFFEVTVAMAFQFFANEKVDIAIIETGLGGRLDSTNIITPELSIITNISYDHQNLLGETLTLIAGEKAGIIKEKVPVIISQTQEEVKDIFINKAKEKKASIYFADEMFAAESSIYKDGFLELKYAHLSPKITSPLGGKYQTCNIAAVAAAVSILKESGWRITEENFLSGIKNVKQNTGFAGRWQVLNQSPLTIADVAHNQAGLTSVFEQIQSLSYKKLRVVFGMVNDKSIDKALSVLPKEAIYYFCKPNIPRGLDENTLLAEATKMRLTGKAFPSVKNAYNSALSEAAKDDIVLVVGSFFVVAEVLD